MEFVGNVVGFVTAWLEVMGFELALLAGFVGVVFYLSGIRPGRKTGPGYPHPSAYQDFATMSGGDFGGGGGDSGS